MFVQLRHVPSKAKIKKYLRHIVFGHHVFCPMCRNKKVVSREERYYCGRCRRRFSLLSHTWLCDTKIPLTQLWFVLWCWTRQMPVKQTQDLVELSEKGVRHWFDMFRNHLPQDKILLEAIVQLDEAYFGGWKGRALLLAKQKGTRRLAYQVLSHAQPNKYEAIRFVKEYIKPESTLATDGSVIYKGIERFVSIYHEAENHKLFEFKNTAEIEGMFGVLRTFIRRMYHHTTPQKFPEYMLEFYFRFSHPEMFKSPRYFLTKTLYLVPSG